MDEIWSFENSVDCPVPVSFAWQYWTHVENWKMDADVESVELIGPFAAGSHGSTVTHSSGRIDWHIAEVQSETSALIEIALPGAFARFRWTFEEFEGGARITQRASLGGDAAPALVEAFAHSLEQGIPAGMRKLCERMAEASPPQPGASS